MRFTMGLREIAAIVVAALIGYVISGFVGPPGFAALRWIVILMLSVPGIYLAVRAMQEFQRTKVWNERIRSSVISGSVVLIGAALFAWYVFPPLYARFVSTQGYVWQCSSIGCGWVQRAAPAPSRRR